MQREAWSRRRGEKSGEARGGGGEKGKWVWGEGEDSAHEGGVGVDDVSVEG